MTATQTDSTGPRSEKDGAAVDSCGTGGDCGWRQTAAQESRNAAYYRGLLVRCGEALGVDAKTTDSGEVVPDVLCAKVPELVEALAASKAAP